MPIGLDSRHGEREYACILLCRVCIVNLMGDVFLQHLQMHEHVDNRLAGRREENRKKNRYKNILPCKRITVYLFCWPVSLRFNGHFPGEPGLAGVY